MNKKINFFNLSKKELENTVLALGHHKFRASQIWQWVYNKGVKSFFEMSNIAKPIQTDFDQVFDISRPNISYNQQSVDLTHKWLLKFSDNQEIETVFIPEDDRGTLCVSSQVGCTLNCKFCHTGTQKLVRNLSAGEIVLQLMVARDQLHQWPSTRLPRLLSNIVMMGMGEPLYNYENVSKAIKIIMDDQGISISRRRITLSTSGVVPLIEQCGTELGVNLAISLHAVRDDLRDILVPLNKKYPIKDLLNACKSYPSASNSKRITFEYVMLKGVNDSAGDAKELLKLIREIPSKVNLIPFNPWPGSGFECSSWSTIEAFAKVLTDAGYASPIRKPRGRDILAACGQLKSESQKSSKSILMKAC